MEQQGTVENGARVVLRMKVGPMPVQWTAVHEAYDEGRRFRDVQVRGPFARWVHDHLFEALDSESCSLTDRVDYKLPLGPVGQFFGGGFVRSTLERNMRYRHAVLGHDLSRHADFHNHGPKRIIVSGATGLVGRSLCAFLRTGGHAVDRLVRRNPERGSLDIYWNPDRGEIDAASLEGAEAVVHLAGENVAGGRWTPERKAAILESRRVGTRLLCETLAGLKVKPSVLVSASGTGAYGNRGDEVLTEDSDLGEGFLVDVAREWEAATAPAREAGIRTVMLRIGPVLTPAGGMLEKLLPPFSLGVGGPMGSGNQWLSWISMEDMLGVIRHALFTESLSGPVNAVTPEPVTNREFARVLGRVLARPAFAPLPAAVIEALFGEMGRETILGSQRVLPRRLAASGFPFLLPDLESALRFELGR